MKINKHSSFDIKKMSEETKVHVPTIKDILGISLKGNCTATTFEEALVFYHNSKPESQREIIAIKKLTELATTVEELKIRFTANVISDVFLRYPSVYDLMFKRWLELVSNVEEALTVYRFVEDNPRLKCEALKKWEEVSWRDLKAANTRKEAWSVHHYAYHESEVKILALKKWEKFSLRDVKNATTFEQAKEAYSHSPLNPSRSRMMALKKWVRLAKTSEELKEVYNKVKITCSYEERTMILKKQVKLTDDISELLEIYDKSSYGSEVHVFVLKRIAAFYGWTEK
jgi:hypothetical protein